MDTNNLIYHILSNRLVETQNGDKDNVIQQTGGFAMLMPGMPVKAKCPKCGSDNIETKWTLITASAFICELLGVRAVRTQDKECEACGSEFQIYRR
jgi:predicted nucleic-acid-binding Zn-ribbon protein